MATALTHLARLPLILARVAARVAYGIAKGLTLATIRGLAPIAR